MAWCKATCGPFVCNLYKGHEGRHEAWGASWSFSWLSRGADGYIYCRWWDGGPREWSSGKLLDSKAEMKKLEKELREHGEI